MGEVPEWYAVIQQAKYLGVKPWELVEQSLIWRVWAGESMKAENEARKQQRDRQERRRGKGI